MRGTADVLTQSYIIQGRAEKELTQLCKEAPGMRARVYRAGYFFPPKEYPQDRKNQRTTSLAVADSILTPVLKCMLPASYTPTESLATFALELAKGRWPDKDFYRNADMQALVKEVK